MIKVLISGASGAMGRVLADEIYKNPQFEAVGILSPHRGIIECREEADVIIDFSNHENTAFLTSYATEHGIPLMICTTGQNEEEMAMIRTAGGQVAVLKSANTSTGVNILMKMLNNIGTSLADFDIKIIEKHHIKKKDAPSGTACAFKEAVETSSERNDVEILSLRAGTIPGEHTVIFAGDDEILELKHTALSKRIFATGALNLAKKLITMCAGFYTTEDLL